jgi:hypothetical protein
MKTMTEFLTATDGKSPEQIKRWYARLPSEEKLQLEAALAHISDEHHPYPSIGASGMSELPGLNFYDRRFERFVCLESRKLTECVAGKND